MSGRSLPATCRFAAQVSFGGISMMDIVVMAIGFICFALSIAYVYACDQL